MSDEFTETADSAYPLLDLLRSTGGDDVHYLIVGAVCEIVASVLSRADVFVIGLAIDALFNERPLVLPLIPAAWIPTEPMAQLWFVVGLLMAMKLADIAAAIVAQIGTGVFSQRVLHAVRVDTFDAVQRLEMGFFDDNQSGDVMSVLNNDVNNLEEFLTRGIRFTLRVTFIFATSIGLMVLLNWQLALFVLVSAPVIAVVNLWFSRVLERLQDAVRSETGALNARIETSLSGVDVIKTFTAEAYESERVTEASRDHYLARWSARRVSARHRPSMRFISGTSLVVTFVVGAYWVVVGPPPYFSGTLTAGQLVPFLFYLQNLTGPMRWIADVLDAYKRGKAAAKRIVGVRDSDRSLDTEAGERLDDPAGRVEYDDVAFGYPGTDERVLDGVEFAVEPGETVGIVGSTGAGKSTLVKLLLRYYDVDEGAVRVDGRDVRDLSVESLRGAIGYVGQDSFLFTGTVAENVAYGADRREAPERASGPEGTASRDRIVEASREAGAHEFVEDLPDGYDTEVGERGLKLSGGQRQRIAIARALLADPPIMVFDEATSHVDNETEALIQRNLAEITADRTTFVIAHRLSTVRDADRILVLDDGRVVESGDHEELLAAGGTYANLWHVQVGDIEALPEEFVAEATAGRDDD